MVESTTNETSKAAETLNGIVIKRAGVNDLNATWGIIKSCSDWLKGQGMNHWDKYYSKEMFKEKLNKQEVYLAFNEGGLVGTITLDTNPVSYYEEQDLNSFSDPEAPAFYVTALAVPPKYQKKGIANKLMEFAENTAKERGIINIRFDCRASYEKLVDFYQKRGYKKVGEIIDTEDNNELYLIMEKILDK